MKVPKGWERTRGWSSLFGLTINWAMSCQPLLKTAKLPRATHLPSTGAKISTVIISATWWKFVRQKEQLEAEYHFWHISTIIQRGKSYISVDWVIDYHSFYIPFQIWNSSLRLELCSNLAFTARHGAFPTCNYYGCQLAFDWLWWISDVAYWQRLLHSN